MGIKNIPCYVVADLQAIRKNNINPKMNLLQEVSETPATCLSEEELYTSPTTMSEDIWKKFDLPTPPLSPRHESDNDFDIENITMPFDIDTEDLLLFDDDIANEMLKEVISTFPESPPGPDIESNLQSNLIQDIMWSAPAKSVELSKSTPKDQKHRLRCNSCSNPAFNTACVAPDEVFPLETTQTPATNLGGVMSQTRVHNLGIETPSDSEEEIDVVTVEKQLQVTVPSKRKYRSDEECSPNSEQNRGTKTVTLTIGPKPGFTTQTLTKCTSVRPRVDCPTDVHNYSLPVTSLKRVHSYPSSPITHKSKKLKRDISIPSDLRKVAQKLKSSMGSCSRNSSDSEEMCESGKRTQHNVLERKRRTDLKNSFFHLRDSVPELEGQERAPKVVILRKASQYINRLIEEQKRQERETEQLKIKKEKLKRHLAKLREY
ncbi:transcriptional regulator Myc-A-like [Mercenaria mercenaria]|uniref:transcriptional regulator Myc-A-like n=1 Tax=Mercenaria mercenaria TaxID=6596 RepID=UPI001E1D895C|nr:transcriptional regulator Myc-A-like [Mercenaria mercenaria]